MELTIQILVIFIENCNDYRIIKMFYNIEYSIKKSSIASIFSGTIKDFVFAFVKFLGSLVVKILISLEMICNRCRLESDAMYRGAKYREVPVLRGTERTGRDGAEFG